MTTDKRTNLLKNVQKEPTDEQVEAAVHAAWAKSREFRGVGGQAEFAPPWEFQQVIRAALVAAQEAAPQAESNDLIAKTFSEIHGDLRSFSHAEVKQIVYPLIDALPAPVLPSSGVDEDALAEVIRKLRFNDAGCWADGLDCTESVSDHADEIARAVAEWLEDQGGESRGE